MTKCITAAVPAVLIYGRNSTIVSVMLLLDNNKTNVNTVSRGGRKAVFFKSALIMPLIQSNLKSP